jgi:hypothetical protein
MKRMAYIAFLYIWEICKLNCGRPSLVCINLIFRSKGKRKMKGRCEIGRRGFSGKGGYPIQDITFFFFRQRVIPGERIFGKSPMNDLGPENQKAKEQKKERKKEKRIPSRVSFFTIPNSK